MSNARPTDPSTDTDQDPWITRLTGDEPTRGEALEELRLYLTRGLAKAMSDRYNGCLQAEDVVQDALIKILDSLDQFAGKSRFTTWAMTIAMRISISQMRRKHFQDVSIESFRSEDSPTLEVAIARDHDVSEQMDRQSMVSTLQSLIDHELTEKQRLAIRSSLAGLPVEVIAEKLGSNRNSVYKMVHDARMKLRAGLERSGISFEDFSATFA